MKLYKYPDGTIGQLKSLCNQRTLQKKLDTSV